MSLKSIQEKMNKRLEVMSKRKGFGIVIGPKKSEADRQYFDYMQEKFNDYFVAKSKGVTTRRRFPGKDTF